jgi:hypothetical protein
MVLLAKFQRVIYSLAGWLTAKTLPHGVEIALSATCKNFRTIHVFSQLENLLFHSYLLDWLTAGLIPLPFQPVWGRVWSIASYSSKIFSPRCNLPERDSLFWLFPRRLYPFSLHGSSFSVLAVP